MSTDSPELKAAPADQQACTYLPHDCYAWNAQVYCCSPTYQMSECRVCKRVTGFRWRSWWLRIRSLFTSEPTITKLVDMPNEERYL